MASNSSSSEAVLHQDANGVFPSVKCAECNHPTIRCMEEAAVPDGFLDDSKHVFDLPACGPSMSTRDLDMENGY